MTTTLSNPNGRTANPKPSSAGGVSDSTQDDVPVFDRIRSATCPSNVARSPSSASPILRVAPEVADAFGMRGLPATVVQEALPPPSPVPTPGDNCGAFIVDVSVFRTALRSLRRSIPILSPKDLRGLRDTAGRPVIRLAGARRIRMEALGAGPLNLYALDYPALPPIALDRVSVDRYSHIAMDIEYLFRIFELSQDLTMSLRVENNQLLIRGSDSSYALFTQPLADAYRLALPDTRLTQAQWLARCLELAASMRQDDTDTQTQLDHQLMQATPAARRRFAWSILKSPATLNTLLGTVGQERLVSWLSSHLGTAISLK